MITPWDYQIDLASQVVRLLREYAIAYLACEERTGKTLAAILAAEQLNIETVLVITKKKALVGWNETLAAYPHNKVYIVTNYHQAIKLTKGADLIILDESHNYLSSYPKPSAMWKSIKTLCANTPIIFSSATPHAQGFQQLFHQLQLSSWSPWRQYRNFYAWFKDYGVKYEIEISGIPITQYDKCLPKAKEEVEHLFITKTREELGFEHEPEDQVHYVELGEYAKAAYNTLIKDNIIYCDFSEEPLVCDTTAKLRVSLHMLEGGVAKIGKNYHILRNSEKIQYIINNWGDTEDLVIMYNYIAEQEKLQQHFKKALILQATSYAEGVDLHKYTHLVIYSQDFSTARHTQRRARQANKQREEPITVHFLLVKKAISEQVYKTVSVNKKNFVDSVFKRNKL